MDKAYKYSGRRSNITNDHQDKYELRPRATPAEGLADYRSSSSLSSLFSDFKDEASDTHGDVTEDEVIYIRTVVRQLEDLPAADDSKVRSLGDMKTEPGLGL